VSDRTAPVDPGESPYSLVDQILFEEISLPEVLSRVTEVAQKVTNSQGAGIILARHGRPPLAQSSDLLVVATDPVAEQIETRQLDTSHGPSIWVFEHGRPLLVHRNSNSPDHPLSDLLEATRYETMWTYPIRARGAVVATLDFFLTSQVPPPLPNLRELLRRVETVIANATAFATLNTINRHLHDALETRDIIGQAKGILMSTHHIGVDEAFKMLVRASQASNRKLRDVAIDVIRRRGVR
jgi:hypothetical protein